LNRTNYLPAVIAIVIVGGLLGSGLFFTRKNHLDLKGEILKVRTQTIEQNDDEGRKEKVTIAAIDFRITNPSNQQFQVKNVDLTLVTSDGKTQEPAYFAELDAQRMFEFYKTLGKKYNPTLASREKIESGQTLDRMIAVRFKTSEQEVTNRKSLVITIEDVDGTKAEITEKR
jgi:hypothetical protein